MNPINLNRDAADLKALLEISQSVLEYLDLDELILCIIKRVRKLLDVEGVSVILNDESNRELLIRWVENVDHGFSDKLQALRFPIHEGTAAKVFRSGQPELIADAAGHPGHYKRVDEHTGFETHSLVAVPLHGKREIIGVLEVLNKKSGLFDERDLDFLTTLSCIIGLALDNACVYTALDKEYRELEVMNKAKDSLLQLAAEANTRLRNEVQGRYSFDEIKAISGSMLAVLGLCEKAIESDISVLIEGETGTGKELIARCIHYYGPRKNGPFVTQNCGALPETLLASELFGYKKGAFTGAVKDKKGLFEIAHGGTIFLDEVGEMSPVMQTTLLRVLQEGEIRPLGAESPRKVDVRVISATNRSLEEEIEKAKFREDLFYRLSVFPIRVPPLRERVEDIPVLAQHFIRQLNKKNRKRIQGLSKEALECLGRYPFPGNVRELRNEIERAMAMAEDAKVISVEHLSHKIKSRSCGSKYRISVPQQGKLKDMVEGLEKAVLKEALKKYSGNKTKIAGELGLSRFGLMKKLQRYGL